MYECKIAEKLVELRTSKGVTQEDLAQSLSVSNKTISKWENGASTPDLPMVVELAKYYGVTTDTLFGLSEDKKQSTKEEIRSLFEGLDRRESVLKAFETVKALVPAMYGTVSKYNDDVYDKENVFPSEISHFYRSNISLHEFFEFVASSENVNVAVMMLRNKVNFAWMNDSNKQKEIVKIFKFLSNEDALSVLYFVHSTNCSESFTADYLNSIDRTVRHIFRSSSRCDGKFFADISLGETFVGTDGATLSFVSDSETVETPYGKFENCQLWITKLWDDEGKSIFKSYYKDGVGIVRHDHTNDGITESYLLKNYRVKNQKGLLPFDTGNTWEYVSGHDPEAISSELVFTVSFANDEKVVVSSWENLIRHKYNDNSWLEMIGQIRCDYWDEKNGREFICDVYPAIERAEQLAVTPMEKAHTKAAASVARRILSTDTTFNPEYTATGHWNFFSKNVVQKKKDTLYFSHNYRWSFEWKNTGSMGAAEDPILYNDILGILQDATNCIWSDEWCVGATPIIEYTKWSRDVRTQITCENGGTITTKAGTFENCFKLCLDIGGMEGGWSYRGGKKVYYFAEGIGIVRTENEYCSGARTAVYELTSYEGVGEGFMPLADGLVRRYDALNLTDGFVGAVEYAYVADEDGDIVVFADRTGIRELPPPITQYSAIEAEVIEDRLWDAGKHKESRLCHDVNNFHLLCHFFGRPSRYWAAQEKAVAWNKYRLKIMEGLGEGDVPDAWLGHYASTSFRTACALFGCGKKEEGYEWLEKAFEAYPKWDSIPDGTEMDVGDPLIYGGIKVVKGKGQIKLPDDTIEPITYDHLFEGTCDLMYYGMTAPRGWEWFNPVRNEDRFKEYIERAKKMANK